jgi:hypothetical protein
MIYYKATSSFCGFRSLNMGVPLQHPVGRSCSSNVIAFNFKQWFVSIMTLQFCVSSFFLQDLFTHASLLGVAKESG